MAMGGTEKMDFPVRIIQGIRRDANCLCPVWMCWMPFLADGEDVKKWPVKAAAANMAVPPMRVVPKA